MLIDLISSDVHYGGLLGFIQLWGFDPSVTREITPKPRTNVNHNTKEGAGV